MSHQLSPARHEARNNKERTSGMPATAATRSSARAPSCARCAMVSTRPRWASNPRGGGVWICGRCLGGGCSAIPQGLCGPLRATQNATTPCGVRDAKPLHATVTCAASTFASGVLPSLFSQGKKRGVKQRRRPRSGPQSREQRPIGASGSKEGCVAKFLLGLKVPWR